MVGLGDIRIIEPLVVKAGPLVVSLGLLVKWSWPLVVVVARLVMGRRQRLWGSSLWLWG